MAGSGSLLQQLDSQLQALFAGWNIYTTLICGVLVLCVAYPIFFSEEPDLHPFFLTHQSSPSPVRQPGESAVYRSLETSHGYRLRTGLNVKKPGAPKWTDGRDGDLRDIWQQATNGVATAEGAKDPEPGRLITILGKEEVIKHDWAKISKDLNAVGQHLRDHGCKRVAICLPNSVETIVSLFASVMYGLTPVLLPYGGNFEELVDMLKDSSADTLVASAGSLPLEAVLNHHSGLRHVVWVAERSSRHMDWNEVPQGVGGKAEVAVWHEITEEKRANDSSELPTSSPEEASSDVVIVSKRAGTPKYSMTTFTQKNLVAAVAAQQFALPKNQRLGNHDVVLLLAPLADQYVLVIALTALYSNASLALTSVAGSTADYTAAFTGITPTVIVASPPTLLKLWKERSTASRGLLDKVIHWRQARSLAAGIMPKAVRLPRSPRLILTYESAVEHATPLTYAQMFDLRIFTGAYVAYAFTHDTVAGAISQTNIYDYGYFPARNEGPSHFGPPLGSVEIKLVDSPDRKIEDGSDPAGWLFIQGPAVMDGQTTLKRSMMITENLTLSFAG